MAPVKARRMEPKMWILSHFSNKDTLDFCGLPRFSRENQQTREIYGESSRSSGSLQSSVKYKGWIFGNSSIVNDGFWNKWFLLRIWAAPDGDTTVPKVRERMGSPCRLGSSGGSVHGNFRQATAASVPPRPSQIQGVVGFGGSPVRQRTSEKNPL